MGFGVTSVIVATTIDKLLMPNVSSGLGIFLIYFAVFCLLHFFNLALSTFEGAIQGVRLNVVEFFDQFYTGGGVRYKPFSYKRVYTQE
jgi:V/A-type H+-transporting ATPase subunit I